MQTRLTDDQIISVVQAHKEGRLIQFRNEDFPDWQDCSVKPGWNFAQIEYRIAPPKPKELWLQNIGDGLWQEKFEGLGVHFREIK